VLDLINCGELSIEERKILRNVQVLLFK